MPVASLHDPPRAQGWAELSGRHQYDQSLIYPRRGAGRACGAACATLYPPRPEPEMIVIAHWLERRVAKMVAACLIALLLGPLPVFPQDQPGQEEIGPKPFTPEE